MPLFILFAALTAGTLLNLFLMILIVGHRRRRHFERVLFCLAAAWFLYYSGCLLFWNSSIYYNGSIPRATGLFAYAITGIGLALTPALLLHAHLAFGWAQGRILKQGWQKILIGAAYLPCVYYVALLPQKIFFGYPHDSSFPLVGSMYSRPYGIWFASTLLVCAACQILFTIRSRGGLLRGTHLFFAVYFSIVAYTAFCLFTLTLHGRVWWGDGTIVRVWGLVFGLSPIRVIPWLVIAWVLPAVAVAYSALRFNFLGFKSQRNLVYAISGAFLALLYLGAVRRVSAWLEPVLPPEATWSILLFVLVGLFEPLQRVASRLLRKSFQEQVDRVQKLGTELQREAQRGEMIPLVRFAEERIREEFGLDQVQIHLRDGDETAAHRPEIEKRPSWAGQPATFSIGKAGGGRKPDTQVGELVAVPIGSAISGETFAALEFLAEQLPAIIELCRTIDQKLTLERELAERERMALVGQMTASISHNLKNPLGSMKTVLQVQLENKELPLAARKDLAIVLIEVDRLNNKLTQLLRYSRPTVRAGSAPQRVEVGAVAEQAIALLRLEAEQRGGRLDLADESGGAAVRGSEEALADIFSNLVVNAIEAMPENGPVSVRLNREGSELLIEVTDDGPGVSPENRARLFQPFFTTKPRGTGLGLAIVERRVIELGGTVTCESPVANGRGARFIVRLPLAQEK
jgi:signal transduction histidine kinase